MTEDRELVVAYMHHSGRFRDALPGETFLEIYALADGFGADLPEEVLAEINGGYDWSHVRDSSERAFAGMAGRLRTLGYGEDGPAPGYVASR